MKTILRIAIPAVAILAIGCNGPVSLDGPAAGQPADSFASGGENILPRSAQGYLNDATADMFLLDVRGYAEHRAGHIAGDVLIPRHVLGANITSNTIYPEINKGRVPRKDQPIIVYCDIGGRSSIAADTLRNMGYTRVRHIVGGIEAWKREGLPVVKDAE